MSADAAHPVSRGALLGWIAVGAVVGAVFGTVGRSLSLEESPPVIFWLVVYTPALLVLVVAVIAAGWCGFTLGSRLVTRSALGAHIAGVFLTMLFGVVVYGIASASGVFAIVWPEAVSVALIFCVVGAVIARRKLGPVIRLGSARTR